MSILESLSFAIHWPTVGWIGVGIVSTVTVAVVTVEVIGEFQRKRRICRWAIEYLEFQDKRSAPGCGDAADSRG